MFEIAEMGDVVLQSGATLRDARLAYKTHGSLNAARDNAMRWFVADLFIFITNAATPFPQQT